MPNPQANGAVELSDHQLDDVQGGLLPAVQAARQGSPSTSAGTVVSNGGTLRLADA